ncbi:DUF6438 domain-containing protein [Hymenobacter negativus]|uniref:DUF6438 domain-containing protein n=1 Tax=Hymenobacter negativus TaxID=2795026 RepID=A0ABS3QHG4_9BACT|nr:DUF6438 domain-containing protein [Hymenobacter negativus]MBO2010693.1 hypothetical protein [Hymenobacter negativus]
MPHIPMRYFTLLLLLSFFGLNLQACAQQTAVQKTKKASKKAGPVKKPAPTEAGPVITFERTPCFGTCPSYTALVYADGRVAYEGRRFVSMEGKKDLKLPAATVADLLRQAKESRFETFENSYSSGVTDVPSTIVAIRQPDGIFKKVTVEGNAPENVRELFAYFGTQFDALAKPDGTRK